MMELLTSPEAWAALLTLTALEIVLGIDNVIFISVIVSRIPPAQAKRARQIGLLLALVFRIVLLSVLVWLIGLTEPVVTVTNVELSWRDIILIAGGAFLIAKATHEIHAEVEASHGEPDTEYVSSGPVAKFVADHPTTKMLALAFLVLIGVALVADGFKFHIPRGYIYFAIVFAAAVELFNMLARRNRRKVAR